MREKNLRQEFAEFIRRNPGVIWVSAAAVLLGYGVNLSGLRVGVDMEVNMYAPDLLLDSWYTIRRYSLVWLKNLFGMREFNPAAESLLMMAVFAFCGVLGSFAFSVFSEHSERMKGFCLVFPALFLSHPCFSQQFAFTMQAFEVAACMAAVIAAAFCVGKWSMMSGSWRWHAAGAALMVFGFGGYQALIPLYLAFALGFYLLYFEFHDGKPKGFYWKAAFMQAAAFLLGYGLYTLTGSLVIKLTQEPWFTEEYLGNQLYWSTNPVETCIGFIKYYMRQVILGEGEFYSGFYLLFAVIFALRLLYVWVVKRRREYVLYGAAAFCLVLSPFFLCFYQGGGILMRTQMALPAVMAFFGAFLTLFFHGFHVKEKVRTWTNAMLLAALFILSVNQANITGRAMLSAEWSYAADRQLAYDLADAMHHIGAVDPDTHVAMVGCFSPELPASADIRQEIIGYSIFEWDYESAVGVSGRGCGFMKAMGMPYEPATVEEYTRAVELSAAMPSWPYEGSVQWMDDVVVVKLPRTYPK